MRSRIIHLVLSLSVVLGASILPSVAISPSASAASAVQFVGGAENFVFYPNGGWNSTDLFGGFKNLMPGDRRTEPINVKNTASDYDYVKIYLRAEPQSTTSSADTSTDTDSATMSELLSQLTLNVYQDGDLLSSSPAAEAGGLETNTLLGTFHNGDETTLVAEISAPSNLSNRYMHSLGEVDWFFTAEGYKDGVIVPPNTGTLTTTDINGAAIGISVVISLALAFLLWFCYHRYYRSFQQKH